METISLAKTQKEIHDAKKLVYETYLKMGYTTKNSEHQGIATYIHQPQTTTIIASLDHTILGTISLVKDTAGGLPMDQIFREELMPIRKSQGVLAEVCQLAVNKEVSLKLTTTLTLQLLSHVVFSAKHYNIDTLVFAVNPKHNSFYKLLGCTPIGEEKNYPAANNNPACAFRLDIHKFHLESDSFLRDMLLKRPSDEFITSLM